MTFLDFNLIIALIFLNKHILRFLKLFNVLQFLIAFFICINHLLLFKIIILLFLYYIIYDIQYFIFKLGFYLIIILEIYFSTFCGASIYLNILILF